MYSFESRVRYSEGDYQGRITPTAILDYFQDCSNFQSEDLHIGVDYLQERHMAWVLVSWQIEIRRYPRQGQHIRVGTWAYDFKGFYGYRNFVMQDGTGEDVAYANSLWVLMDMDAGHPVRISQEMADTYTLEKPYPMEYQGRKMKLPQGMEPRPPFPVQRFHLDTNNHVNNGKYILMAQEYLPEGFVIGKIRAEYRKSALYGDTVYPTVKEEEQKVTVALNDKEGQVYAIVELERL